MGENYITVVNPHFQDSTPLRNLRKVDKSSVLDCAVGDMVDNNNTSIPLKDLMDNACNGTTRFYITWPEY